MKIYQETNSIFFLTVLMTDAPIMKDYVGLIQQKFEELIKKMIETIGFIQNNNSTVDVQTKYDQLQSKAEEIVKNVNDIDILLKEADEQTSIGKSIDDIVKELKKRSDEYEDGVRSLSSTINQAEVRLKKIENIFDVIAKNTPWMEDNKTNN